MYHRLSIFNIIRFSDLLVQNSKEEAQQTLQICYFKTE